MNPSFILIILCLTLGALLKRSGKFPREAPRAFNAFVIWVSLPALILVQIPALLQQTRLSFDLLIPVSMAWIQLLIALPLFYFIGKKLAWSNAQIGALILTAGLGNTSFVGFPILESLFGQEGLRVGVLNDQGTFLAFSTVGLAAASLFVEGTRSRITPALVVRNVMSFPPFIALMIAVIWHVSGTYGPGPLTMVFERLSVTLIPLALISVGFQLSASRQVIRQQWKPLLAGLGFKLLLAPLFFIVLYVYICSSHTFSTRVTILESAMAPMITGAIVAEEMGLDAEISNLMVGVGIPISIITVYLWNWLPLLQGLH
ncbi:MAG: AEC family transporter [Candidatus Omnitrophota bacterium]